MILCLHLVWRNDKFYFIGFFHSCFIYSNLQSFNNWGDKADKEMVLPSPRKGGDAPKGDVPPSPAQGCTETLW